MESSDWIALGAAVLSLIAVAVSVHEALSNKPRLRLSASSSMRILHPALGQEARLGVSIVNFGRQPTTITSIQFAELKRWRWPGRHRYESRGILIYVPPSTALPKFLEVGKTADIFYELGADWRGRPLAEACTDPRFRVLVKHTWTERFQEVRVSA